MTDSTKHSSADSDAGWFADWDDEQTDTDYGWQPCFETGRGHIPCFQVWFKTKAECEEWIADNVIGAGWFRGDPTEISVLTPADSKDAITMNSYDSDALREAAAIGWDACVAALKYEDGAPVEIVTMVNPYRDTAPADHAHHHPENPVPDWACLVCGATGRDSETTVTPPARGVE